MRILLILVGGTICTALNSEGTLSVSEKAGAMLKSRFENSDSPYAKKVEIDLTKNLFILSENMTIDNWNSMIDTYRKYTAGKKYDGIIFAHGTDTLAYSAALFSMLLAGTDIPVFFVSANARLDASNSNGDANFRYAVEAICRGIVPNVYATYENISDERMYLHLASRLEQCRNYSEDFFSAGQIDITDITDQNCGEYFAKLRKTYPAEQIRSLIDVYGDWHLKNRVLMLSPYVGMDYSAYNYDKFAAVLHGTFHSGTACAEKTEHCEKYGSDSILYMIDRCAELGVDTYYSPSKMSGEVYETVMIIGKHEALGRSIKFLHGCTNEMAYAKLLLAYSLFDDSRSRDEFINTECNFEIIQS